MESIEFNVKMIFMALLLVQLKVIISSSISNPHRQNSDIDKVIPDYFDNKKTKSYHESIPLNISDVRTVRHDDSCQVDFKFRWSSSAGSSVFSTPVIFPIGAGGKKHVFQTTFYHFLEMIGHDGFKPWGWPLTFEKSSFQGSPVLYDLDGDGYNDIGIVDKNANMYWVRVGEFGQYLEDYHIQVPRLKVKRDWAKTLDPETIDRYAVQSMFDHETRFRLENNDNPLIKKESKAIPDHLLTVKVNVIKPKVEIESKSPNIEILLTSVPTDDWGSRRRLLESNLDVENQEYDEKRSRHGRLQQENNERERQEGDQTQEWQERQARLNEEERYQREQDTRVREEQERRERDEADRVERQREREQERERNEQERKQEEERIAHHHLEKDMLHRRQQMERLLKEEQQRKEREERERLDREEEENRRARLTKDFVIEERVEDSQSIEAQRAEEIRLREEEEQRLRDEEYMRQLEREEQQQAMDMMSEEEANRLEEIRLREIEEQARRDEEYLRIIEDEKRRARLELASIGGPINERAPESISEAMSQPVGESGSGSESEDASPGVSDQDQTHVAGVDSGNDPYAGDTSATQGQFGNNFEHLDDYISHRHMYAGRDVYQTFDDGYRYYGHGHGMYNESDFVFVDAHVLGSPVLFDVNKDGRSEMFVAVSYYFDRDEYRGRKLDFDIDQYIGGGLGCWDLHEQTWLWLVHLDLSTDKTKFKALIHSTPTVVDLDGDGRYEVVLGTSLGLLYVLDADTGFAKRHFPMQFHELQSQTAVADVTGNHNLEIIVNDMGGNLVLLSMEGDVLWDRQLSGSLPHTPTVGDVDGDGSLDIVVVAVNEDCSHIWAVSGDTGVPLPGYPISLPKNGIVTSSVLLTDLNLYDSDSTVGRYRRPSDPHTPVWVHDTEGHTQPVSGMEDFELDKEMDPDSVEGTSIIFALVNGTQASNETGLGYVPTIQRKRKLTRKGLHLVAPTFDGHVYIIDGVTHCAERIDVGEHIYSMPLLDDVTGDGFMDLLVGTVSGQVVLLESSVPYHPTAAWSSFPRGRHNGFTYGQAGISVPLAERERLRRSDVMSDRGQLSRAEVTVSFDIWDRRLPAEDEEDGGQSSRRYTVSFSKSTNNERALLKVEYTKPGRYTVRLPIKPPEEILLVVGLTTEHGQYYEDVLPVSVGTKFYVWIKYLVVAPTVLLSLPLLMYRR